MCICRQYARRWDPIAFGTVHHLAAVVMFVAVAVAGLSGMAPAVALSSEAWTVIGPASSDARLHPAFNSNMAALSDLVKRLPKAELHIHIEGTLEVDMMFELARRNGIELPYADEHAACEARANFTCLEDFLKLFTDVNVLQTEEDFRDLAAAYLRRAADANVKHAELHFDAQGHMVRGITFETVLKGLSQAIAESPVDASLILCIQRGHSEVAAANTLVQALPYLENITTVGLAGPEVGNPPGKFQNVFYAATQLNLHKVAHAGEEGGASYVHEALKLLGAERIDHGIRSLEDPTLVAFMADAAIPITLCPISNLRLQVYKGQLEERIRQMLGSGVRVTINSDDPAYFGSYIEGNYEWVAMIAGLGPDDLAALAANSFEASFLSQERKAAYVSSVWETLNDWKLEQQLRKQQQPQQQLQQQQ